MSKLHSRLLTLNVVLVACGFAACWSILIWAMGRGYDFTDESYYLIWASMPWHYSRSVSEFGFLWHPVYELVRGDIRLFRIAGAVLLSGSGALFGWSIWRFIRPTLPRSVAPAVIVAMAAASFWNLNYWIPTPGYNELNLIGLLLFMAGLIFAVDVVGGVQIVLCALLLAIGLVITAFAKPTTALCALLIGLLWLVLLRPKRPIALVLSAAVFSLALFLSGILAIDGGVHAFIQRQLGGLHTLQILSPGHGLGGLYRSTVDPLFDLVRHAGHRWLALQIVAVGLLWGGLLLWLNERHVVLKTTVNIVAAVGLAWVVRDWRSVLPIGSNYEIASISPLLLTVSLGIVLLSRRSARDQSAPWRPVVALAILSFCAAFCFSVGTNNRTLYHESLAAVFWFAALILLASAASAGHRNGLVSGAVLFGSFMTVGLLAGATENPYRLVAPISQQTESVTIGPRNAALLVDKTSASYIRTLQAAARTHGFESGTPVIDLTGASPGTVFALAGTAPGRGWLNGGYPGSAAAARESLSGVSASDLSRAWVLTVAGNSPDRIPDTVLQSLGLNFPADYEAIGRSCKGNPCLTNILWKPVTR